MKFYRLLLLLCFCTISCNSQTKKINGVSFVASGEAVEQSDVNHVKKVSANNVALMPFGFIKTLDSPKIRFNSNRQWFGETEKGVKQYAEQFRKNNIKAMLKPQIWVWRGEFTGYIEMKSEENWKILEDSYSDFILFYAKLAQEVNIEILCIGTELEKFVLNRPDYWKNLINEIKKVYSGKLTYAANWDEFKRIPFWKDIDYIGIDAYFPLSDKKSPTIEEFEKGWQPHKKEIQRIRKTVNKPVLFTEYGYRSIDFTGKEPWQSNRVEGQINHENQQNATQALHNQFWKEDWFAGGFIWKWFHKHNKVGGLNNNRFTPQNKPTEKLLKKLHEQ